MKTTYRFTESSILDAVRRIYGLTAEPTAVNEMFIPGKGWVPSLFQGTCRNDCGLCDYLLNLTISTDVEQVNLKISGIDNELGCANADFAISELAE